jgi:carbonic anhydrase
MEGFETKEEKIMPFCTAINCIDGRVQLPVIMYLQKRFNAEYVDSITEAGPGLVLSESGNPELTRSILNRLKISIEAHQSVGIAVVGHYDCAGNLAPKEEQIVHLHESVGFLLQHYPGMDIIGLWVDEEWDVHEVLSGEVRYAAEFCKRYD